MLITPENYLLEPGEGLGGHTLPALFSAAVAVDPDAVAVTEAGPLHHTWSQWRQEADALSRGLQELGLRSGQVVAAQLPNTWDFLVLHIAVAAAGAVLLPLHGGNGVREVDALARATEPAFAVIAGDHTRYASALRDARVLGVESLAALKREWAGATPLPVEMTPDSPLVLMPTSGTTSTRPKICVHTHDSLLSNAAAVAAEGGSRREDALLSASPFSHLFGLLSVHLSLCTAGRQVVLGDGWDVRRFLQLADEAGPDVLFAVPAQLRDIVAASSGGSPRLREVRTGGAAVPGALVRQVTRATGARVVVQWGMTEVGAGLATRPGQDADTGGGTVGRPNGGAQVRVVGPDGRDCADGEPGELLFRTPYRFRGYLGEPELTRAAVTSEGWLRTGDRASLDSLGVVSFLGRAEEMINVGGQKFSAVEIEELLSEIPGIRFAAVVGRADERLGEYPCVAVTTMPGALVTLETVTEFLVDAGVAAWKLPLELIEIEDMPRTPSGKIARRRLRDRLSPQQQPGVGRPLRRAEALRLVRAQATEILGAVEVIGTEQRFADYGLDSRAGVRLRNRLAEATGRVLPSTLAFDFPTPDAVARFLSDGDLPVEASAERRQQTSEDPVVIIGMACRLPGGVDSPGDFWRLLREGRSVPPGYPADRGGQAGRAPGGFLPAAGEFDPEFFGISAREARAMDPQQRLLLEVSWEAFEQAGVTEDALRGSDTGVFTGVMGSDYGHGSTDSALKLGTSGSVASGRLAYILDLHGPAITVDTACSSSLVALHLAAQSLRHSECDLAVAGGATVMSAPPDFAEGLTAEDGRCKAFGAGADGVGWSEGVGAVVLERLSDAQRHGHPILAVVRGSAINSDGASNGLISPSGPAQQRVIRKALRDAGLEPSDVDAVEAHGTGTAMGDPIEAQALLATYGLQHSAERPLWLGSVKSNLGHTQAAGGVVGVIKMVLALRYGVLPKTLHAGTPTPQVDWSPGTVRLLTDSTPWSAAARRRAAVSAFGASGTNAHLILEEPPEVTPVEATDATDAPWVLSARSESALKAAASRLRSWLAEELGTSPGETGRALATTRSAFAHRAVLLAGGRQDALDALIAGADSPFLVRGEAKAAGDVVFAFPGHGAHWAGMARELLVVPAFAESIAACDAALTPELGWSILSVLNGQDDQRSLSRLDVAQPALFAVMVSLAALWRSYGVHPDVVVGHSQGEVAAAHVAGGLTLADAARIVAVRSRMLHETVSGGAMAVVSLGVEDLEAALRPFGGLVSVAAFNGPRSAVVSGAAGPVGELLDGLRAANVEVRDLGIATAGHSPAVEPLRNGFLAELSGIRPRPGEIPFYSTADADWRDTATLDAGYWYRHLREPVRFAPAIGNLIGEGYRHFVEVGPHPVLAYGIEETADALDTKVAVTSTLRRDDGGVDRFRRSFAEAYAEGVPIDWTALFGSHRPAGPALPTYPFQRRAYWLAASAVNADARESLPAERLSALDEPARRTELLTLIRSEAATIAGLDGPGSVAPEVTFSALGLTSLTTMELRGRLARTTGVRLPLGLTLDNPTPSALSVALSALLWREPDAAEPVAAPEEPIPADLESFYHRLHASGRSSAALELLAEAAAFRGTFTADRLPAPAAATRLSSGCQPTLVCFPSVVALGGPEEYSRLGVELGGAREVLALSEPGFLDSERLPADLDALVDFHAKSVLANTGSAGFVLCGHSSGGWVAHATAKRLEDRGIEVAGVVLIDSFWPDAEFTAKRMPALMGSLSARQRELGAAGMTRLSAMGGYLKILADWEPLPLTAPTLHLAVEDTTGFERASWRLPHTARTVPGDHLSVLDQHCADLTKTISAYLPPGGYAARVADQGASLDAEST